MTTLRGRTPEDDEQAGATDNRETPANRYGYPPLLGECLCGHQFRKHVLGGGCLAFVVGWDDGDRESPCDCALFEAAIR